MLDSFTFLFSAIMVMTMHVTAQPPRRKEALGLSLIGRDVIDSLRFLREQKELRGLITTIGLAILGGATIIPVGTTYVKQNLSGVLPFANRVEQLRQLTATPTTFMLVFMAFGMVAGALLAPRIEHTVPLRWLFGGSVLTFGLALLGFASVERYPLAGVCAMLAGGCLATVSVAGNGYVVRTTSDVLRGRVFTALESVQRLSLLISMIVMAPIADIIGTYVYRFALENGMTKQTVYWTGSRITLQLSSLIVMGAAFYAFRTLRWKAAQPAEETEHA